MFALNEINEDNIQIYGTINGSAVKKTVDGSRCWGFVIKFFKGKVLHKVMSNEKDGTIWNTEKLKKRIQKAYDEAE